jgi:hypothetical protein
MSALVPTTPQDLLTLALTDAGIVAQGQTPSSWDMDNGFARLNMMIGEWSQKRWTLYHNVDVSVLSTGQTTPYTVGPSGQINVTERPDKLEAAYFRQIIPTAAPNQFDTPLDILHSYEDWAQVSMKQLTSFSNAIFYDSDWPLGKAYPWPVMLANIYELHLILKMVLSNFTALNQTVSLPRPYFSVIHLNMAQRLRAAYNLPPQPRIDALVKNSMAALRGGNTQISRLYMPRELIKRGVYNPYSDQVQ